MPAPLTLAPTKSSSVRGFEPAARTALPLRGAGFIDLASQRVLINSPTPQPDIAALQAAVISLRAGTPILLRDVAKVTEGATIGQYERYNMQRMLTLGANVSGEDLGRAADRARPRRPALAAVKRASRPSTSAAS